MRELLLEIGTEELPGGFIDPALSFLKERAPKLLSELRLSHGAVHVDGTPRRLVLIVEDVAETQTDLSEEKIGPPLHLAKNPDGTWSQAVTGFLKKNNLEHLGTDALFEKNGKVAVHIKAPGQKASAVLPQALEALLRQIPFKKTMSWGDGRATHKDVFARPVQWLLALLHGEAMTLQFADVKSGNTTRGHRYHAPQEVVVTSVEQYRSVLNNGHVMLSRAERKQTIVDRANALAQQMGGALKKDDALLELVKNLVEKPFPVLGHFEARFLEMPKELLISEMREHQKYFAIEGKDGKLLPAFVVVAGADSADKAALANGNARVLRARFEDGAFYFRTDREKRLADRVEDLGKQVFHRELGTVLERAQRIEAVAHTIAGLLHLDAATTTHAVRAAKLCKADLTTGVVSEFPELQGVMGRDYAKADGEAAGVALAIEEHYFPKGAGAALPSSIVGAVVALADRLDTLVGILGIGKAPTGSADPFALRRAAIGVLTVALSDVVTARGSLHLDALIDAAVAAYQTQNKKLSASVKKDTVDFVTGRLRGVLVERCTERGLLGAEDIVDAAMQAQAGSTNLVDVEARTLALATMRHNDKDAFVRLAATFKRVSNILNKARTDKATVGTPPAVAAHALVESEERALRDAVKATATTATGTLLEQKLSALSSVAGLKPKVDAFFDKVLVMDKDPALQQARLGLLALIEQQLVDVADFTRVQTD